MYICNLQNWQNVNKNYEKQESEDFSQGDAPAALLLVVAGAVFALGLPAAVVTFAWMGPMLFCK
jgi:hypothetical protein